MLRKSVRLMATPVDAARDPHLGEKFVLNVPRGAHALRGFLNTSILAAPRRID